MYTFGSPRVGNQAFAEYVDQSDSITNFRLTHNEDIGGCEGVAAGGVRGAGETLTLFSPSHPAVSSPAPAP